MIGALTALVVGLTPVHVGRVRVVNHVHARCTIPMAMNVEGELPSMYRERWREEPITSQEERPARVAQAVGALAGVGASAIIGVLVSSALTDVSLSMLTKHGYATPFLDNLLGWVDATNQLFKVPTVGELAMAVAASVDVLAVSTMLLLASLYLQRETASEASGIEHLSSEQEEGCVLSNAGDSWCGAFSFDSTEGYACVESMGEDGKWRWMCA